MARQTLHSVAAALVVTALSFCLPAGAQGVVDPAEADAPARQRPAEPRGGSVTPPGPTPKRAEPTLEERRLHQLRQLEARLSVGQALSDDERRLLGQVAVRGETPRARALAAAILPWLTPAESAPALLAASDDEDARVRDQALQGLVALTRRLDEALARRALEVGVTRLSDPSAEVACTAARVVTGLSPERAGDEVRRLAPDADDIRYACWRSYVSLPARDVEVPPPPEPADERANDDEPGDDSDEPPAPTPPPEPAPAPTGDLLFWSTAAATGFLAGGLLPGLIVPPHDTLVYSRRRTVHAREELSIGFAGTTALAGALLVGGAALGATTLLGPLEVPAATSSVLGATAGALAGLGGGMTFGLDDGTSGVIAVGASLSGLALSSALAFTLPPRPNDIGLAVGLAGQGALAATLISLAAVPVDVDRVLGDSTRVDFALGTGMLAGGVLATGGLLLAPLVDVSPGRILVASAAGASAAGLGLGLTYLFTPATLDVRERVASGVGAGLQLVAATAAFVLLPGSWADAVLAGSGGQAATSALYLDEGELRVGLPVVTVLPVGEGHVGASLPLLGGRF